MLTVEQTSLDAVMADPHYKFKSAHFRSVPGFDGLPDATIVARFRAMLTSDPAHMMPGEKGSAVLPVHTALEKIFGMPKEHTNFGYRDANELALRKYGPLTQRYISQIKTRYKILNHLKAIDLIIGKKTIRALDFILWKNGK